MKINKEELFPLVDVYGNVVGQATRKECHSGSKLLHPVVHLHVIRYGGFIYLQKRSMSKDIQPGKWDTAVGGHVDYGESVEDALRREAREELGFVGFEPIRLEPYVYESGIERELINPFIVYCDEDVRFTTDPDEISEGKFWRLADIESELGKDVFTPNFESEYQLIKSYIK